MGEGLNGVNMIAIPLVNEQGRYLRVEDVATVEKFTHLERTVAFLNGEESIFVAARMQPSLRADVWTENALAVVSSSIKLQRNLQRDRCI